MMRGYYRRFPKELDRVNIPADKAEVVFKRLEPLIDMWPIEINRDHLKQFALSCYTQGLLDSQQIGMVKP